jgi:hypothetical protein
MSLRVIFDRKLYREVVWSFEVNRVLDTNFTFFKSKIHSNWHIFKLTSHLSRLFTVHHSLFFIRYSPLTTHDSRLTCHFEWFSVENCIEKCFEVLSLIEFSIQILLFSKAKFTRTDMYSNSPLTSQDYSLFIIRYFLFVIRYSPLTTHLSLLVIFGRKLYREVLWSFELNRVLDTNFTFFKSKIHWNWHSLT